MLKYLYEEKQLFKEKETCCFFCCKDLICLSLVKSDEHAA
jgi:hypothetical protein